MPAAAHLATIQLLVGPEPVIAAPTSSGASTSQSRRVTQITSTRRRNPLFGIATAVAAVPTVASLVHGLPQMAARAGLIWKALKVARSVTVASIIRKTGTIRESRWTRTTPTAFSLTPLMYGLLPGPGQYGTISPVVIPAGTHVPCTWTSMRSRFCQALLAFWQLAMMAASTELQTPML